VGAVYCGADTENHIPDNEFQFILVIHAVAVLTIQNLFYRSNRNRHLELVAQAAESLSSGDIVEKAIRSKNAWNLLPTQVSALLSVSSLYAKQVLVIL
jgi:hypothetical protein